MTRLRLISMGFSGAADGNEVERLAFDGNLLSRRKGRGIDGMQDAFQRVRDDDAIAGDGDTRTRGSLQWPSML